MQTPNDAGASFQTAYPQGSADFCPALLFCAEFATIGLVGSGLTPHEPCGIRKQVQGLCGTTAVNGTAAASREARSAAAKQRSTTSAAGRRSHWGASSEKAPRRLREPEDGPPSEAAVYPAGIFAASLPRRTIYHKEKDTMKQHFSRSLICLILVLLLAAAGLQGCASKAPETTAPATTTAASETATVASESSSLAEETPTELGEGAKSFTFEVTDVDGSTKYYTVHTDAETVGEALVALGLIAGEDSEYGLYVKTVDGVTLDYDTDGKYWAFYVDGEYATAGVDSTAVTDGASYAFRAE